VYVLGVQPVRVSRGCGCCSQEQAVHPCASSSRRVILHRFSDAPLQPRAPPTSPRVALRSDYCSLQSSMGLSTKM